MANTKVSVGGVGFGGLLTLLFIALRLIGVIHWAWYWVLAPLWVPAALLIVIGGAIITFPLVVGLFILLFYWVRAKLFKK